MPTHAALIREFGAAPIDYQREDFKHILSGGFDVVFDGIGEDGYRRSFAALKRGGLLCAYGYTAGVQAQRRMLIILMWIAQVAEPHRRLEAGGLEGKLVPPGPPIATRARAASARAAPHFRPGHARHLALSVGL
jgi:NADPH:quinone reductase-like Zn-dependent oxidoreductase